jgi:hypothetical protein
MGRVPLQHPAALGVTESLGDDGVDVPGGARRQTTIVHPGVETVEVDRSDGLELDVTDRRHDV